MKAAHRPIRAGQAYLDATRNDPQAQVALKKLRVLAKGTERVGSVPHVLTLLNQVFAPLGEYLTPELKRLEAER